MALLVLLHSEKVVGTRQVIWARKAEHRYMCLGRSVRGQGNELQSRAQNEISKGWKIRQHLGNCQEPEGQDKVKSQSARQNS